MERWWEGRCLWGALIFAAINFAQQGQCWIEDKTDLRRLCCSIVSFSFACKCQLRGLSLVETDGKYLQDKGLVKKMELNAIRTRNGWQPYYFLSAMREAINNDLSKSTKENSGSGYSYRGSTAESQLLLFEESLNELAKSIGGLIRVKSTGLPLGYDIVFIFVLRAFFVIATLAWTPLLGWYTAAVIGVSNLVVHLIICLGTCLEDPFGEELTDLPLDKFCKSIETQIEAVYKDKFIADEMCAEWPFTYTDEKEEDDGFFGESITYQKSLVNDSTHHTSSIVDIEEGCGEESIVE